MVQQRLGYIIKRAQQTLRTRMDTALEEAKLTTPQYAALSILEEEEAGLSNAELARRCFLTPQTMHKIVTGMEEKGMVERESDSSHGRKINTLLTDKGRELLNRAHKIVEQVESDMTEKLNNEKTEQTIRNLQQCIDSLEGN